MEFIAALLALFDGCFGFLEIATLFLDGAAVYRGIKTYRKRQRAEHHALRKPSWLPFIVLLVLAVLFTALLVCKYTRP